MGDTMSLSSYVGCVSKWRRVFDTHVIHVCSRFERAFVSSFLIAVCFSLCYATASNAPYRMGSSDRSKLHHTALRNALLDSAIVLGHFAFITPQERNLSVDLLTTSSRRDRSPPQV